MDLGGSKCEEPKQPAFDDDASMHIKLKAVSETTEGTAETMIHPSGLLETTTSDCLEYNFWLCCRNLTGSKESAYERQEVFCDAFTKGSKI